MEPSISKTAQIAVAQLLRPLVRLLLRYGVPFGAFMEIAKRVYVDVAMADFQIPGRKPTVSRASVITGLTRKEVQRLRNLPPLEDGEVENRYNRAVRVISGWVRDRSFTDTSGVPAPLPLEGDGATFAALVRRYSGDVPMRAVLDELERVGAVERDEEGRAVLHNRAYIPTRGEADKLGILGTDVADLVATIDHNLREPPDRSRLQLKVAYDNLPREPLAKFKQNASQASLELLERFDKELSSIDRDVNAASQGTGRMRAGVGIYYFEEERTG